MARAKDAIQVETSLYERNFCLWLEEQARLLGEGPLDQIETGLAPDAIPPVAPWSLEEALDPDFLPD
jgi:hypothetical protein